MLKDVGGREENGFLACSENVKWFYVAGVPGAIGITFYILRTLHFIHQLKEIH